jgi:putative MATE family efflux protein
MAAAAPSAPFDRSLVDGPVRQAVWKLAWPTMLQNAIGGLQGVIDHALVGHLVGYTANAAIGVSWQLILVVIVFISSLYTGMAVLVARAAGAGQPDQVNRVVYQAAIATLFMGLCVLAPAGYVLSPWLLGLVNAAPAVREQALPFLRIFFLGSIGMLMFFMLGGALRAAGDARTPLRLGIGLTVANVVFNVALIRGVGPIPPLGTSGAALGTVLASLLVVGVGLWQLRRGNLVVRLTGRWPGPDWGIIRQLFRFGLPAGVQGVVMNVAGVMLLRYIGSLPQGAEAQAAFAVGYTELFSLITWTSVGLMGAAATLAGQSLGAGRPARVVEAAREAGRLGLGIAAIVGAAFLLVPRLLLGVFGMSDAGVLEVGEQLLRYLAVSGFFITLALTYTGALQGTGDTRSPLVISLVSQVAVPLGICAGLEAFGMLSPGGIWRAIVLGHLTRCALSIWRFRQERWRDIRVETPARPAPVT